MSRYERKVIPNGEAGWDADTNTNFQNILDKPIPIFEHSGDESDLEATFAAAQHDNCLVWVDHTTQGWVLYHSDGSSWDQLLNRMRKKRKVRGVSSADSVAATDDVIELTGSGTFALTLPSVGAADEGFTVEIKQNGTGVVTVTRADSDTIDGATTYVMGTQYEWVKLIFDGGTNWMVMS